MKLSSSLVVVTASFLASYAAAQGDLATGAVGRCSLSNLSAAPPSNISAQRSVAEAVRQAQACLQQRDAVCAANALSPMQTLTLTLSDDERAFLAASTAELATLRGESAAAEATYREALALPTVTESLQREIAARLALILIARGEFAEVLRLFDPSKCRGWTADALALRALAYERLGARLLALENYAAAETLYGLEGNPIPAAFADRHRALEKAAPLKAVPGTDLELFVSGFPAYPQQAMRTGTSGWVQLEFRITDMGAAENIRLEASSNKVFEQPSIAAVQRWRYVPKFENGLPVARGSEQTVLKFCLEPCTWRRNPPPERGPNGRYPSP